MDKCNKNEEEYVAIIFKRVIYDEEREFLLPESAVLGDIKYEGNTEYFESIGKKSYENLSEHNRQNSNKYYGFPISVSELRETYEYRTNKKSNSSLNPLLNFYLKCVKDLAYYQKYDLNRKFYMTYTIDENEKINEVDIDLSYFNAIYSQMVEANFPLRKEENDYELDTIIVPKETSEKEMVKEVIKIKNRNKIFDVMDLYNKITSNVIGQDDAVKKVICAIAKNKIITNPKMKENVLLYGPTGCGKTEIMRNIKEYLNVPIEMVDANDYTITGYIGKDVDDIIKSLYYKNNCDVKKTEEGIIFIDEIDKLCSNDPKNIVTHIGVQQSLLKLVEGKEIEISNEKTESKRVKINTSKITFIFGGSFAFMKENTYIKKSIGFGSEDDDKKSSLLDSEKLIKYGLIPELVGRISVITEMKQLTKDDLKQIVLVSNGSQLKLHNDFLAELGVDLCVNDEFVDELVEQAIKMNTGARSLNSTISNALEEAIFEILSSKGNYKRLTLSKNTLKDNKQFVLE